MITSFSSGSFRKSFSAKDKPTLISVSCIKRAHKELLNQAHYLENIPTYLKELNQWMPYRLEPKAGGRGYSKVPVDHKSNFRNADKTNQSLWLGFDHAVKLLEAETKDRFHGIGFCPNGSDILFIDIDKCIASDGALSDHARHLVDNIDGWVEKSVSGKGLHIVTRSKDYYGNPKNNELGIELFQDRMFVAMTGDIFEGRNHFPDTPVSTSALVNFIKPITQVTKPNDFELFEHNQRLNEKEWPLERVKSEILPYLDEPNDYNLWLKVGSALKHQYDEDGFDAFDEYSQRCIQKYDASSTRYTWDSISNKCDRKLVTLRTLIGWANEKKETGFKSPSSLNWLKDYLKDYNYSDEQPVATNFVIDGFLSDEIFAIAGAPGTGKSSMLFQLAMAVAHLCPEDYELKPILRRKVVYLTEDARQAESIIFGMKKWGGVKASTDEMHEWLSIIETRRLKPEVLEAFIEWKVAEKTVKQKGEAGVEVSVPPLIVLDTAAATFDLENESDNSEVSNAISHVKHACAKNNTPLWIIAHSSKAQRNDTEDIQIRGASAWTGDVNGTAYIFAIKDQPNRYMRLRKRRFEAEFEELEFSTKTYSIPIKHPLGHLTNKTYRVGLCKKSSAEQRTLNQVEAKQSADKEKEHQTQLAIVQKVFDLGASSKRAISNAVNGQNKYINHQVDYLVSIGELIKNSSNKFELGAGELNDLIKGFKI